MLGPEGGGHPGNDSYDVENQSLDDRRNHSSSSPSYSVASQQQQQQKEATHHSVLNVHVVSNDESLPHQNGSFISGNPAPQVEIEAPMALLVESPKKPDLSRNSSSHEQCRVCQQENDEALIDLGCHCRGGLAKAHQSCITAWFSIRGSNKCEICQQIAANVALPESQASASYWVWRLDPAYRGRALGQGRERGCFSPLWVAFAILIGGLLLDVLISITLGVSALPVNIIIGVIVVLGLGTALRLALEFCHEWSLRRVVHRVEANASLGYHPAL